MIPGDWSAGEVGGVFAGLIALLAAIGKGFAWLIGWRERREESRAVKLQRWHDELDAREKALAAERAGEIAELRSELRALRAAHDGLLRQHGALGEGYQLIAVALHEIDSGNEALRLASDHLRSAFPASRATPPDMIATLDRLGGRP